MEFSDLAKNRMQAGFIIYDPSTFPSIPTPFCMLRFIHYSQEMTFDYSIKYALINK